MKNGLVACTAFRAAGDVPNHRMYLLGCCSPASLGDCGAGLAAAGAVRTVLLVQKQLLWSASMALQ